MERKRVPDWLNSSLWSTTPSDDRLHRYSPSPTTTTTTSAVSEPTVKPPVLVPPPTAASRPQSTPTPPKSEIRDPVNKNSNNNSNDNDQNGGSSGDSLDDISRQAQLLAEVFNWFSFFKLIFSFFFFNSKFFSCQLSKKVINLRELRRIASQGIPDGAGIRSTVWKVGSYSFFFITFCYLVAEKFGKWGNPGISSLWIEWIFSFDAFKMCVFLD